MLRGVFVIELYGSKKLTVRLMVIVLASSIPLLGAGLPVASADSNASNNRSETIDPKVRKEAFKSLPPIQSFMNEPSDRFLVELALVRRGHPYRGERAERPHTGGHVYFQQRNTSEESYPAIYAVADGVISRVDYSFELRSMFEPALGKKVANTRYGIGLTFATDGDTAMTFHYSIEPFIRPESNEFYDQFILVKPGQRVTKGQVIARMYLPGDQQLSQKSHIHFNLLREGGGGFVSPSIFNDVIVREFHRRWNLFPNDPDGPIPPCMGYKLSPTENPFSRRAVDRL